MRLIDANVLKRKEQRIATQSWKMKVKASVETILNQFIDDIDHAPTVDAVPVVHGTWKTVEDWDGDEHYKCSVCGDEWFLEAGDPKANNMNYCPNCGADMREEDHGTAEEAEKEV